ncbi:unnamed protein product [Lathyrus sativus]|nr:unnamed protein product [Lathyrus sativus]
MVHVKSRPHTVDHDCCTKDMSDLLANSNILGHSFCGKSFKELFEQL